MGSLVQPESDVTDVEAGAAHDDRRHHRGRNRRHDLARRQDVLLLHERERHRGRHIWAVPTAGGTPTQVTTGKGIETYPAALPSGALATLSATWNMPMSVGLWTNGTQKIVFPTARPGFPTDAHVEPQLVITHPADNAFEIHNQLFLPKDIKPGDRKSTRLN